MCPASLPGRPRQCRELIKHIRLVIHINWHTCSLQTFFKNIYICQFWTPSCSICRQRLAVLLFCTLVYNVPPVCPCLPDELGVDSQDFDTGQLKCLSVKSEPILSIETCLLLLKGDFFLRVEAVVGGKDKDLSGLEVFVVRPNVTILSLYSTPSKDMTTWEGTYMALSYHT